MKLVTAILISVLSLAVTVPTVSADTLEPTWFKPGTTAFPVELPWPTPTLDEVNQGFIGWWHNAYGNADSYERVDIYCHYTEMEGVWVCQIYWWVFAGGKWYLLGIWREYVDQSQPGVDGGAGDDSWKADDPVEEVAEDWGLRNIPPSNPALTGTFDRTIYAGKFYDQGTESMYREWHTYRFQRDGSGSTLINTQRQYYPDKPV